MIYTIILSKYWENTSLWEGIENFYKINFAFRLLRLSYCFLTLWNA